MKQSEYEIFQIKFQFPYPTVTNELGYKGILPVLELLNSVGFPPAVRVAFKGKNSSRMRKMQVHGYLDPKLTAILEPVDKTNSEIEIFDALKYSDGSHGSRVDIHQGKYRHSLTILIPIELLTQLTIYGVQSLFHKLVQLFPNAYAGECSFLWYRSYFSVTRRSCFVPYLVWRQYLSAKELEIQGGKAAFESNNLLKTERIHDGLLIEVGESPYDIFTDEGEALLAKATESLPPVVESAKK
ncbi:MAG: hypothetical protein RL329_81 [Bacteroidota bacterium]|jgi:hypothetical protein